MKLILYCLLSFPFAWMIHLCIWRIALPNRHTRALLIIFFSTFVLLLIASSVSILPRLTWAQILQLLVLYVPTALAYICFYSAIEEDSPSVGLIALTARKEKCMREDYYVVINDAFLVKSRLHAMIRDGLLTNTGEYYSLTPEGLWWGRLFCFFFEFLKLKGAG